MVDLVWMMNQLVDQEGNILVEGLMDSVAPVTAEEEAKYHSIGTYGSLALLRWSFLSFSKSMRPKIIVPFRLHPGGVP
jgi:hypothetical protein